MPTAHIRPRQARRDRLTDFLEAAAAAAPRPQGPVPVRGDLSARARTWWTPQYRAWFDFHGGDAGFRRREAARAGRAIPEQRLPEGLVGGGPIDGGGGAGFGPPFTSRGVMPQAPLMMRRLRRPYR